MIIRDDDITRADGESLTRWEKVFIYNHMAQGGQRMPTGKWKGFEEFPNTVSKVKTMAKQVEVPLAARFQHRPAELKTAAIRLGGEEVTGQGNTADVAFLFHPFPRVPVTLLFWDEDPVDGFAATVKLLFDETVIEHLDIESIVFLSERLRQLLEDTDEKET
ncbi:DUF3786 domain-containing protein [Desulfosarcina cetonica]|uniref:DUF3786 domain-containing protein n=1 Tax=Desulfosarcina cetonica TaxID=90730 RepID=UPI001FF04110|nr:DUF3786 domain-containing protein [Desulfosarcina cetonica]